MTLATYDWLMLENLAIGYGCGICVGLVVGIEAARRWWKR